MARGPVAYQPCGTPAAARRHYRRGEKPCRDCLEANRLSKRPVLLRVRRDGEPDPRPVRNGIPWRPYIYQGTGRDAYDGSDLFEEAS